MRFETQLRSQVNLGTQGRLRDTNNVFNLLEGVEKGLQNYWRNLCLGETKVTQRRLGTALGCKGFPVGGAGYLE